jgi:hypothetical protein
MDGSGSLDALEEHISKYDTNLDGTFSVAEVKAIVEELEKEEQNVKNMQKIIFGVVFLAICGLCVLPPALHFSIRTQAAPRQRAPPPGVLSPTLPKRPRTRPVAPPCSVSRSPPTRSLRIRAPSRTA